MTCSARSSAAWRCCTEAFRRGPVHRFWCDTGPVAVVLALGTLAATASLYTHLRSGSEASDFGRLALLHDQATHQVLARLDQHRTGLLKMATALAKSPPQSAEELAAAASRMDLGAMFPYALTLGLLGDPAAHGRWREEGPPRFAWSVPLEMHAGNDGETKPPTLGLHPDSLQLLASAPATTHPVLRAHLGGALSRPSGASPGTSLFLKLPPNAMLVPESVWPEPASLFAQLCPTRLAAGIPEGRTGEVNLRLRHRPAEGESIELFSTLPAASLGDPRLRILSSFGVGDRRWTLETAATPSFQYASRFGCDLVLLAGCLSSLLVVMLLRAWAQAGRRVQSEANLMATVMTRDLRRAAETDRLTGLRNRSAALDAVERAVTHDAWRVGRHHAVLFMDFDRFKRVNDTLGHAAGDELLCQISGRILQELRSSDIVGLTRQSGPKSQPVQGLRQEDEESARCGEALPARMGGDEFVLLLRGLKEPDDALEVAERLLTRLSEPYRLSVGGPAVRSTPSIGVAIGSPELNTAPALIAAADAAMYAAKNAGGACVRLHGPGPRRASLTLAA